MEQCSACGGTDIASGSWTPSKCRECGAIESPSGWYHEGNGIDHEATQETVFTGRVYIRPCGRGISVVSNDASDLVSLYEIFEEGCEYDIHLVATKVTDK